MPDETPKPTPTDEAKAPPTADELLRQLSESTAALNAERQASAQLRETFVQAVNARAPQHAAPEPEPEPEDIPTPEDFDDDHAQATARLSATMIKRGLTEYDHAKSAENAELRDAVLSMEWDKVRTEDPKNFDRLSKHINQALQSPGSRRPGAVKRAFYALRGQYMQQLNEMDRKEQLAEPVPNPNPPVGDSTSKEPEADTLNAEEILVIKGMNQSAEQYFATRYGKKPEFADGYLRSLGLPEATK